MFERLEPKMFPIAISLFPLRAALTLTSSSGSDVPIATTVKPIRPGDMPSLEAIDDAPSTKILPPSKRMIRPSANKK